MGWKGDRQILVGSRKLDMAVAVAVIVEFAGRRHSYTRRPVSAVPS